MAARRGPVMNANSLRLWPAVIALTVAAFLAPVSAQAGFIYDLTVSGFWTGSGSITFDTLSGNAPSGVSAFSFHTSTGSGSPQDYDLADIESVNWSIDSSFNLSLLLSTALVPFGPNQSAILLTNQSGGHVAPCSGHFSAESVTCFRTPTGSGLVDAGGVLSASLVPASVPEPSTVALFAMGLAGLGLMKQKRRGSE